MNTPNKNEEISTYQIHLDPHLSSNSKIPETSINSFPLYNPKKVASKKRVSFDNANLLDNRPRIRLSKASDNSNDTRSNITPFDTDNKVSLDTIQSNVNDPIISSENDHIVETRKSFDFSFI